MNSPGRSLPNWPRLGLLLLGWTLIGLSFASQFYISSSQFGRPVSWTQALSYSLADWYVFAVLSVPTIWLALRFPLEGRRWGRNMAVHLAASGLFSLAYMILRAWVGQWQAGWNDFSPAFVEVFRPLLVKTWHFNLLVYWVIVCVSHAFDYYRKYQERLMRTSELEARLAQARLHALQMQLNPHFLFNTLHAVSSLMHQDVEAADRMITRLSDLLRVALEGSGEHEVPLQREITVLRRYLDIEQIRFGDRLQVDFDLPPDTVDAAVPNLVLQPIVENAIRHGIEKQTRPGRIELHAARDREMLILTVRDNGAGFAPAPARPEGVGLSNTRARLVQLYGSAQSLDLRKLPEGGSEATIRLPFHLHPQPSAKPGSKITNPNPNPVP
ncbi:MAG TPA: histidine kinase [Methylomirabilota bacterium]|nr:histidine kinase [Methylomirabilota bacterium]